MLTFEACDGRAIPIPHPQDVANSLRAELTLQGPHPAPALAHALVAHLEGSLRVKLVAFPKSPAIEGRVAKDGALEILVPSGLYTDESVAQAATSAAATLLFHKLGGRVDDEALVGSWSRQFARWFLG